MDKYYEARSNATPRFSYFNVEMTGNIFNFEVKREREFNV